MNELDAANTATVDQSIEMISVPREIIENMISIIHNKMRFEYGSSYSMHSYETWIAKHCEEELDMIRRLEDLL